MNNAKDKQSLQAEFDSLLKDDGPLKYFGLDSSLQYHLPRHIFRFYGMAFMVPPLSLVQAQ
jgi:hypothetical protein